MEIDEFLLKKIFGLDNPVFFKQTLLKGFETEIIEDFISKNIFEIEQTPSSFKCPFHTKSSCIMTVRSTKFSVYYKCTNESSFNEISLDDFAFLRINKKNYCDYISLKLQINPNAEIIEENIYLIHQNTYESFQIYVYLGFRDIELLKILGLKTRSSDGYVVLILSEYGKISENEIDLLKSYGIIVILLQRMVKESLEKMIYDLTIENRDYFETRTKLNLFLPLPDSQTVVNYAKEAIDMAMLTLYLEKSKGDDFERATFLHLNQYFNYCIPLGLNYRGEAVPDGMILHNDDKFHLWDCKAHSEGLSFSEDVRRQIESYINKFNQYFLPRRKIYSFIIISGKVDNSKIERINKDKDWYSLSKFIRINIIDAEDLNGIWSIKEKFSEGFDERFDFKAFKDFLFFGIIPPEFLKYKNIVEKFLSSEKITKISFDQLKIGIVFGLVKGQFEFIKQVESSGNYVNIFDKTQKSPLLTIFQKKIIDKINSKSEIEETKQMTLLDEISLFLYLKIFDKLSLEEIPKGFQSNLENFKRKCWKTININT